MSKMNLKALASASTGREQIPTDSGGGKRTMKRTLLALTICGLASFSMWGQDVKDDLKKSGEEVKKAGKETGKATKHAGKAVAKGTKKGVHKAASGTAKGAEKLKEKTN
jgi:hypothetical protein